MSCRRDSGPTSDLHVSLINMPFKVHCLSNRGHKGRKVSFVARLFSSSPQPLEVWPIYTKHLTWMYQTFIVSSASRSAMSFILAKALVTDKLRQVWIYHTPLFDQRMRCISKTFPRFWIWYEYRCIKCKSNAWNGSKLFHWMIECFFLFQLQPQSQSQCHDRAIHYCSICRMQTGRTSSEAGVESRFQQDISLNELLDSLAVRASDSLTLTPIILTYPVIWALLELLVSS